MTTRTVAVAAAAVGAAALAATGITYASATGPAQAAPFVQQAAPAMALAGGGSGGRDEGDEGRDRDRDRDRDYDYDDGYGYGYGYGGEGRIHFNERTYSAHTDGCITVVSGLGSRSFNVRNDSRKTVEVFRGATCDNGSPIATVGPWSTTTGVTPRFVRGGVFVRNGVVGSFRVVDNYHDRW
ncbi:hypothetical protein AB0N06_35380 [Streptomyces sp. NPDC051020]|uniref:hypothetical protein n=1 Tax=Streptomyces sp. NPDC051020 TaxID=3155409 RepID=UPI00343D5CCF